VTPLLYGFGELDQTVEVGGPIIVHRHVAVVGTVEASPFTE
jgi:hypothetical protein